MGRPARQKRLKRGRRLRTLAAVVVVVSVAVLSTSLAAGLLASGLTSGPRPVPRAAIVDQLSERDPNPAFVAATTEMLEGAGYVVDYYPGEQVTVDFYRELPTHGHDLIVLRSHSSPVREVWRGRFLDEVVIFTSEPYSPTRYRDDQKAARLAKVHYYTGGEAYFGIMAYFVRTGMQGTFEDATIILMGCGGPTSQATANALLQRGAKSFVTWTGPVSGSHSDAATERLLQLMLIEGLPTVDAVLQTDAEVGPDPASGAKLRIFTP